MCDAESIVCSVIDSVVSETDDSKTKKKVLFCRLTHIYVRSRFELFLNWPSMAGIPVSTGQFHKNDMPFVALSSI